MKSFRRLKYSLNKLLAAFLLTSAIIACKKDNPAEVPVTIEVKTPVDNVPATGSRDQLTKDSIFLYARQVYLWWDEIPDYKTFNPRKFTSLDDELYAITRFGINPATSKPYEFDANPDGQDSRFPKYSYISDATSQGAIGFVPEKQSSVDLEGNGNDFGLLAAAYGTETEYSIYVQAVYPGSAAAEAGFRRGDRFNKINGRTIGTNYNTEYAFFYNALFGGSTVTIEGKTSANASFTRTVNKTVFKSSPIYKDSVYTAGDKKIGYMAYARFSSVENSLPEFTRIFKEFSQKGVTDLILDFRYNGGGYVSTAEHLINLIAPASLNGKVMFVEYYNELMRSKKATILSNQPLLDASGRSQYQNGKLVTYADVDYSVKGNTNYFKKEGSLNTVKNIVFIVSENTASASELVINSLRPYLNVKIVGATSYGKPVGFFPLRVGNYDVYLSMFETQNSKGEGRYYAGFTPDTGLSTADNDNPNYDFGDLKEASFSAAYNYLTKGSYFSQAAATISSKRAEVLGTKDNRVLNNEFKGMIQSPGNLKLNK